MLLSTYGIHTCLPSSIDSIRTDMCGASVPLLYSSQTRQNHDNRFSYSRALQKGSSSLAAGIKAKIYNIISTQYCQSDD